MMHKVLSHFTRCQRKALNVHFKRALLLAILKCAMQVHFMRRYSQNALHSTADPFF